MGSSDEPVTPAGRLFLQPEVNIIINCILGGKLPIDISAAKLAIKNSIALKHPRFCSIMVKDRYGREKWRKTTVDIDRHVIILTEPVGFCGFTNEEAANAYLAELAISSPLSNEKPLWEVHLLMAHNCAVLRVHHALGDGISLMSMLLSFCRKASDPEELPTIRSVAVSADDYVNRLMSRGFWGVVKTIFLTVVYVLEFVLRTLWVKDKPTQMCGGAGIELWPRKMATAKFVFDDLKIVKNAVPNATINDVLWGIISAGISRYLDIRSSKGFQEGHRITGVSMVNLRPQLGLQELSKLLENNSMLSTSWGNKFGAILLPVYYHKRGYDPLYYVKRARKFTSRKKLSLEAYFSYKICQILMSIFGPKFASLLNYNIMSNTTFTISNMVGPEDEVTIAGNPVEFIRSATTSLPHAITMYMLSYAGRAEIQIMVAKDIIPDPEVLAKCFENALLEMKNAVTY